MPKKPVKHYEPQVIPDGRFCKLLRPNLWQGFDAMVEGYENGLYIVRVTRVDSTSFRVLAKLEELKVHADTTPQSIPSSTFPRST